MLHIGCFICLTILSIIRYLVKIKTISDSTISINRYLINYSGQCIGYVNMHLSHIFIIWTRYDTNILMFEEYKEDLSFVHILL